MKMTALESELRRREVENKREAESSAHFKSECESLKSRLDETDTLLLTMEKDMEKTQLHEDVCKFLKT